MSLLPLLILVFGVPFAFWTRERRRVAREGAARALGFAYERAGLFGHDQLAGTRNGVVVQVRYFHKGSGKHRVPWTRVLAAGPPFDLTLKRQHVGTTLLRHVTGGRDLRVGDPEFDDGVIVDGNAAHLAAALDVATRHAVRNVLQGHHGEVTEGMVRVETRGHLTDPARLGLLVDAASDLGARLSEPVPDAPGRLRAIVREDPEPGVRSRALRALEKWHDAATAAAAAGDARNDPDPRVRLQAALVLGEPLDAVDDDTLLAAAPDDPHALARALAKAGDEARLGALLAVDDATVRVAACHGLARVGTVRSVQALTPLTTGLFADGDVKSAARGALESIRARMGDVDAGRVAVVDGGGNVAIAGEQGAVAVAQQRKGTTA